MCLRGTSWKTRLGHEVAGGMERGVSLVGYLEPSDETNIRGLMVTASDRMDYFSSGS